MIELEYGQTVELSNGEIIQDIEARQTPIGTVYASDDYVLDSNGQCLSHDNNYDVIRTQS